MDIFLIQSENIFHINVCLLTVFVRNVSNLKRDGFLWGFMCRSVLGSSFWIYFQKKTPFLYLSLSFFMCRSVLSGSIFKRRHSFFCWMRAKAQDIWFGRCVGLYPSYLQSKDENLYYLKKKLMISIFKKFPPNFRKIFIISAHRFASCVIWEYILV